MKNEGKMTRAVYDYSYKILVVKENVRISSKLRYARFKKKRTKPQNEVAASVRPTETQKISFFHRCRFR